MKICDRAIKQMRVMRQGDVMTCCQATKTVGNLLKNDLPEIRHGEQYRKWLGPLFRGDYSQCALSGTCDYLGYDCLNEHLIEIDNIDAIPDTPEMLHLGFESICNYRCTCCYAHSWVQNDTNGNMDQIVARLEEVLPRVKSVYANAVGEVFASPRTMRLLNQWRPLAPDEECVVTLQSNGSLFTPSNWEKVKNIGRFHVKVRITVMSFDEEIFRHLSGTKLPISLIEDNLHFIRSLREQGIVNEFGLGTVMQEENFRQLPQFVRRAFDEFGVDSVRVNKIFPGGKYDSATQWFMDVMNPKHPYFDQCQRMLTDPVFHDPRVVIEGGFSPNNRGENPGVKFEAVSNAINKMLDDPELLLARLKPGRIGIFGLGTIGKMIVRQYRDKLDLCRIYATQPEADTYGDIPYTSLCADSGETPDTVLVTSYSNFESVSERISAKLGDTVEIVNFWDLI